MKQLGRRIIWQRATDYLAKYQPILIGIAGSVGKTFTKEALRLILSDQYLVRAAPGSYNSHIGVALSILGLTSSRAKASWLRLLVGSRINEAALPEPDIIILELGADRPGDIDSLAQLVPFKIGLITNIQSSHLRLFTSKELVAHELASLVVSLPDSGTAILNADDPLVKHLAHKSSAEVLFFGSQQSDVQLRRVERMSHGGFACEISVLGITHELHLPDLIARHQLHSILAALAAATTLDVDIKQAIPRLQAIKPLPGRMNRLNGLSGSKLIDDSYNASPESTLAALDTLAELPAKRRLAILGDMLDLGADTVTFHQQIGTHAAAVSQILVTVGDNMRSAGAAALKAGDIDVHHFDDARNVGKWLSDFVHQGDSILIKGSRDMHMEDVTRRLLADPTRDANQLVR